jgi:hypothetical protein
MHIEIQPKVEGLAAERLMAFATELASTKLEDLRSLTDREASWARRSLHLNGQTNAYEAAMRLLADLRALKWTVKADGFGMELESPRNVRRTRSSDDAAKEAKELVRKELHSVLSEQFSDPSVRVFVAECENPPPSKKTKSIRRLIASGSELRARIEHAVASASPGDPEPLASVVDPYLQLVPGEGEPDRRDEFTGLRLAAIWRYFRYTWSIPQTPIPGRQLFYLIRDRAHPCHAVIGIAALGNSPLLSPNRDKVIGWTTESYVERFLKASESADRNELGVLSDKLMNLIDAALTEVDPTGLVDPACFANPPQDVIDRLQRKSHEFASQREQTLRDSADADRAGAPLVLQETEAVYDVPPVSIDLLNLEGKVAREGTADAKARRLLVAKKRAFELARLLKAKATFLRFHDALREPEKAAATLLNDDVRGAMNTALLAVKSERVGTNMLEITTCGAVSPYNHLLGGKLVALLLVSPEVADDYMSRYGERPSIISSQLKNTNRTKDCTLVWLNTTSLYAQGSSQYERLRLPAGIISPQQKEIRFSRIGDTVGYGTVQFSDATVRAVEAAWQEQHRYSDVNSIFGEGFSPKFRKLRDGMTMLGFNPTVLMRHDQTRRVFAIPLWSGADSYLRGESTDAPDYVRDPGAHRDATARIAAFWRQRWLASRLRHGPAMDALRDDRPTLVGNLIQNVAPKATEPESAKVAETEPKGKPSVPSTIAAQPAAANADSLEFWKELAVAGPEACADELSLEVLSRIHVPQPLDDLLIERVKDGWSIVLTGNAGDGKTHLLRRLEPQLTKAGAVVELDATAAMEPDDIGPVLKAWKDATAADRPYCLAANEFPFYMLRRAGRGFAPVDEADWQARHRLAYDHESDSPAKGAPKVLVVDLGLRNPLHPDFALPLLRRLLEQPPVIEGARLDPESDLAWNYQHLSNPLVQERLGRLLARCAAAGQRAPVRELLIWFARLLFGTGTDAARPTRSPGRWYATRLFETDERFVLSRILREWADPAAFSHPRWDWRLESGEVRDGWRVDGIPQMLGMESENFRALKRRFYFEHELGEQVFDLNPAPGGGLVELLASGKTPDEVFKRRLIESINRAYCSDLFPEMSTRLYLWVGHRYHEQPSHSHVANQNIPETQIQLATPRLHKRMGGGFSYQPDHIMMSYSSAKGSKTMLRIDCPLMAALEKLNAGLPRQLLPDRELNRLDGFLEALRCSDVPASREFMIHSHDLRSTIAIALTEDSKTYTAVRQPVNS